jgi:hypothetical protein
MHLALNASGATFGELFDFWQFGHGRVTWERG